MSEADMFPAVTAVTNYCPRARRSKQRPIGVLSDASLNQKSSRWTSRYVCTRANWNGTPNDEDMHVKFAWMASDVVFSQQLRSYGPGAPK